MDPNCAYCGNDDVLQNFGYPIGELEHALLYLFKEQTYHGRVIVATKTHVSEITELSDADRDGFFADMSRVAKALHALYQPTKINYAAFGDTGKHCHFHLVPKYEGGEDFGGMFVMNSGKKILSETELQARAAEILEAVKQVK